MSLQGETNQLSPAIIVQLHIPGMAGKQRTTTPKQYLDGITSRVTAARKVSGLTPEQIVRELNERVGNDGLKVHTYKKWETRTPIRHEYIIPFCQLTGIDVYVLLTGVGPFQLSQHRPTGRPGAPAEKNAA